MNIVIITRVELVSRIASVTSLAHRYYIDTIHRYYRYYTRSKIHPFFVNYDVIVNRRGGESGYAYVRRETRVELVVWKEA